MLKALLFLILSTFLQESFCQFYIKGRVSDNESQLPLKGASVYLNNTTKGTMTDEHGEYIIGPLPPGRYELVASFVGFEPAIFVADLKQNGYRISFRLDRKENSMREVLVLTNEVRHNYLEVFKKNVLGYSAAADKCKIKNIDEVQFVSGSSPDEVHAYADLPLEIENPALGYTIYFTLVDYFYNKKLSSTHFYGYTRFVDQDADERTQKKFLRKRQQAYEGSTLHFFRSLVNKRLDKEGFKVYTQRANETTVEDSLIRLYSDSVYRVYELVMKTGWRIIYEDNTQLKIEMVNKQMAGVQPPTITIIGLRLREAPVLVSDKGIMLTPIGLYYDGIWAFERLANMLPVDYEDK